MLEAIADQQASGVLEIQGSPAGTIYFDQGQITYARASWIPDLNARLLGSLRSSAESRDLLIDGDRPERDICTMLIRQDELTRADLQRILRSVVVDAVIVLTAPINEDSFVTDIQFAACASHWASAFSRLPVDSVQQEATGRAERLRRQRLSRRVPVRLRDLGQPSAMLSREQWALACMIGDGTSAEDLAWQCGLPLYAAIEYVGDLVRAGMCVTCAVEVPESIVGASAATGVGQVLPAPVALAPPWHSEALPHRTRGTQIARAQHRAGMEFGTTDTFLPRGSDFGAAPPELLHRVLDGLRKIG